MEWSFRVTDIRSNYLLLILDLVSGEQEEVQGLRLRLFSKKYFDITQELLDHLKCQKIELLVIDSFLDIRR